MTDAGQRNCLMTFYRRDVESQNGYGETVEQPTILRRAWCKLEMLSGGKLERANQVAKDCTHEITALWSDSLRTASWAEYQGVRYDINAVENVNQQNHEAMILAKAER